MAKILTLDEMLDALKRFQDPDADHLISRAVDLADEVALTLQKHLQAEAVGATFEPDAGGTAVPFHRLEGGPDWPEKLDDLDEGGEFLTRAAWRAEIDESPRTFNEALKPGVDAS